MKPHALLFPYPLQGHINGFMQLAHYLISSGILVTVVHSPHSYSLMLQQKKRQTADADPGDRPKIRVEVLPDHSSRGAADSFAKALKKLAKGLEPVVEKLIKEECPATCIISDSMLPDTQDVANKYGIPRADYCTSTASVYSIGVHIPLLMSKGYIPHKGQDTETVISCIPGLPPMRARDFPDGFLAEDITSSYFQVVTSMFQRAKEAKWLLIYSFPELEGAAFEALRAEQIHALSVGSLFPLNQRNSHKNLESQLMPSLRPEDDRCLPWLDRRATCSVLYIAFGSYSRMSAFEIQELALGLEKSLQPFLWVIRTDAVAYGNISDFLPDGFISRTKDRGLIVSWAPQQAVLSHPSVGGFLSHCGWNSTMESMYAGVPIIGWPRGTEQVTNLKFIAEDWKIGIVLEREWDRVSRQTVEQAVIDLMQGEVGREARRRAGEMRDTVRDAALDGSPSKLQLDEFVEELKKHAAAGGHP